MSSTSRKSGDKTGKGSSSSEDTVLQTTPKNKEKIKKKDEKKNPLPEITPEKSPRPIESEIGDISEGTNISHSDMDPDDLTPRYDLDESQPQETSKMEESEKDVASASEEGKEDEDEDEDESGLKEAYDDENAYFIRLSQLPAKEYAPTSSPEKNPKKKKGEKTSIKVKKPKSAKKDVELKVHKSIVEVQTQINAYRIGLWDTGLDVTLFDPPGESFRAQPLNSAHVQEIMKSIILNPYQKGKIWSVACFKPEISDPTQWEAMAVAYKKLIANKKPEWLEKFQPNGEFYEKHGVISGNHTRQAYVNIKKLMEQKGLEFVDGKEGFGKSVRHSVEFFLIPCSIDDHTNFLHEYLKCWGNEKNKADTKTQTLSNYSVLSEGRVLYNIYKNQISKKKLRSFLLNKLCTIYQLLPNRVSPIAAFIVLEEESWKLFWELYTGAHPHVKREFALAKLSEITPNKLPGYVIKEYLSKCIADRLTLEKTNQLFKSYKNEKKLMELLVSHSNLYQTQLPKETRDIYSIGLKTILEKKYSLFKLALVYSDYVNTKTVNGWLGTTVGRSRKFPKLKSIETHWDSIVMAVGQDPDRASDPHEPLSQSQIEKNIIIHNNFITVFCNCNIFDNYLVPNIHTHWNLVKAKIPTIPVNPTFSIVFLDFPYFEGVADWDKKALLKDSPFNRADSLMIMLQRVVALNHADSWVFVISFSTNTITPLLSSIQQQLEKKPVFLYWVKPAGSYSGSGDNYIEAVETILVIYMGDSSKKKISFAGPELTNRKNYFEWPREKNRICNLETNHPINPAQKPIDFYKHFITVHSAENSFILDLTAGSGVVTHVCKNLHRNCFYNDLDVYQYKAALDYYHAHIHEIDTMESTSDINLSQPFIELSSGNNNPLPYYSQPTTPISIDSDEDEVEVVLDNKDFPVNNIVWKVSVVSKEQEFKEIAKTVKQQEKQEEEVVVIKSTKRKQSSDKSEKPKEKTTKRKKKSSEKSEKPKEKKPKK